MPPITEKGLIVMRDCIQVLCHSITCSHREGLCPLGERCGLGKGILKHIILCDPAACNDTLCTEYRGLLEHYITCTVWSRKECSHPVSQRSC